MVLCELTITWCCVVFTLYICFFYFNKLYMYYRAISCLIVFSLFLVCVEVCALPPIAIDIFGGIFNVTYCDILVHNIIFYIIVVLVLLLVFYYFDNCGIVYSSEYMILFYVLVLSTLTIIYCNDFIALFLFIELQSISLYILLCLRCSHSAVSIGIRYFLLSSIVTLIFFFSMLILYYCTGLSNFIDFLYVEYLLLDYIGSVCLGGVYLLFLFKLYIYPFHFIGGALYRSSPLYILLFMSSVLYYTYIYIYIKLVTSYSTSIPYMYALVITTIFISTLNVLLQRDIRSFLGFGTSVHSALLILMLFLDRSISVNICLVYAVVYIISLFSILVCVSKIYHISVGDRRGSVINTAGSHSSTIVARTCIITYCNLEYISGLGGLLNVHKYLAAIIGVLIWSIAGLPPFIGFFTKISILSICFAYSYMYIFSYVMLISFIASLYYLKVLKELYYMPSSHYYVVIFSDFELLILILAVYVCGVSVFIPDLFIFLFY